MTTETRVPSAATVSATGSAGRSAAAKRRHAFARLLPYARTASLSVATVLNLLAGLLPVSFIVGTSVLLSEISRFAGERTVPSILTVPPMPAGSPVSGRYGALRYRVQIPMSRTRPPHNRVMSSISEVSIVTGPG